MPTFIPIPIRTVEQERELPSKTYLLDLERGRIFAAGSADGIEAVNQYIKKALLTPRFRCLIYDNQYGSEIKQTVIAGDATPEYIEAETPRLVRDALMVDTRILDVYDFSFVFEYEKAHIKFKASTIFGETVIEEMI
jgi:hypothetical protein